MRWRGRRQSENIQDSRGRGGFGRGMPGGFGRTPIRIPVGRGGGGISGIILLVVLFFALRACGIDPMEILSGGGGGVPGGGGMVTEDQSQASDEMKQFVGVVLAETEDVWNGVFQAEGQEYQEPTLSCSRGRSSPPAAMLRPPPGPFYCPARSQGLSRHHLLRAARPAVRRRRRLRAGLCGRPRGRPSCPEPDRRPAEVQ